MTKRDPEVIRAMRGFKKRLLLQEAAQMRLMAHQWLEVEKSLEAFISDLARDVAARRAAGEAVSQARLFRLDRYKQLLTQARREFERYAGWAADLIERHQRIMARLGIDDAYRAVQLSYWPQIRMDFARLPIEATEHMIGLAGNGAPLGNLLRQRMIHEPGALDRLTDSLVKGTALGWNPRKTARAMKSDLAAGLQKALTISRSEQLRVYRMANLEQMRRSGVVLGWKRLVAHDARVCAGCLADEKTLYPLEVLVEDHPQGRCTPVPVVEGMPEVDWLAGEDWLLMQPEAVQRTILGSGRYEAWKGGADFKSFTARRYDPVWGSSIVPTPLRDLAA